MKLPVHSPIYCNFLIKLKPYFILFKLFETGNHFKTLEQNSSTLHFNNIRRASTDTTKPCKDGAF